MHDYDLFDTRDDIQPEFMDGKNIFDFVDPDIKEKLERLEQEEEDMEEETPLPADNLTAPDLDIWYLNHRIVNIMVQPLLWLHHLSKTAK